MPGIFIDEEKVGKNINEWIVTIEGADGTIYEVNEIYFLNFIISWAFILYSFRARHFNFNLVSTKSIHSIRRQSSLLVIKFLYIPIFIQTGTYA